MTTHLVIPDTQCKPGISLDYCHWIGQYIVDKQPDVVVHLGDHADMPSLSIYDRGKLCAEGRRVVSDIEAAQLGWSFITRPIEMHNKERAQAKKKQYNPRRIITLGNHEDRLARYINDNAALDGILDDDPWGYAASGWEVYPFLKPVIVDGVTYCHFMANPFSGKPYGGSALNVLKNVGESFVMGHRQTLDLATRYLPASGRQQWGIVAGACYEHAEEYKGHQGNHHWRGLLLLHEVDGGSFSITTVSLDYLRRRYA